MSFSISCECSIPTWMAEWRLCMPWPPSKASAVALQISAWRKQRSIQLKGTKTRTLWWYESVPELVSWQLKSWRDWSKWSRIQGLIRSQTGSSIGRKTSKMENTRSWLAHKWIPRFEMIWKDLRKSGNEIIDSLLPMMKITNWINHLKRWWPHDWQLRLLVVC